MEQFRMTPSAHTEYKIQNPANLATTVQHKPNMRMSSLVQMELTMLTTMRMTLQIVLHVTLDPTAALKVWQRQLDSVILVITVRKEQVGQIRQMV